MASDMTTKGQLEFLWKVHGYTNEYIRFADPKAGIALAVVTGLTAALFSAKAHEFCYPDRLTWAGATWASTSIGLLCCCAFGLLFLSAFCFARAITPRRWGQLFKGIREMVAHLVVRHHPSSLPPPAGFIYWGDVVRHADADEYLKAARNLTTDQQAEAVATHVFVLAHIADSKFRFVSWGFRVGYAGSLAAVAVLFVIRSNP